MSKVKPILPIPVTDDSALREVHKLLGYSGSIATSPVDEALEEQRMVLRGAQAILTIALEAAEEEVFKVLSGVVGCDSRIGARSLQGPIPSLRSLLTAVETRPLRAHRRLAARSTYKPRPGAPRLHVTPEFHKRLRDYASDLYDWVFTECEVLQSTDTAIEPPKRRSGLEIVVDNTKPGAAS